MTLSHLAVFYKTITATSSFIHFSLVLGLTVLALSLLTLFVIAVLKIMQKIQSRRQAVFKKKWQAVLAEATFQEVQDLPQLPPRQFYLFIKMFNSFHKHMHGASGDNLNKMAYQLQILPRVLRMLHSRRAPKKLTAVMTLGYLRELSAWDDLVIILQHANPLLAFAAALSLQNIHSENAMAFLIPKIIEHTDWPATIVAQMLQSAGPLKITKEFARAVLAAPAHKIPKLMKYFKILEPTLYNKELRIILGTHTDPEVIAAGLGALNEPKDSEIVVRYLQHPIWYVRVQAMRALGRLGSSEHIGDLTAAMNDPEWWVRYRAAQALLKIPGITQNQLAHVRELSPHRLVREILNHVMSEGRDYSD